MKIIKFSKNIKGFNRSSVIVAFVGTCLVLMNFLISFEQLGYHGITVWFQLPALIFCFSIFCLTLISYLRNG